MEGPIQLLGEQNRRLEYDSRFDLDSSAVEVPQEIHVDYQISRRFSTDSSNVHGESTESTRVSTPINEYDVEKQQYDTRQSKGDTHVEQNTHDTNAPRVPLRERLHHFTWAWWTLIMSTGGLSLLIFVQPYQFPGLKHIGLAVYLLTLVLFVVVFSAMVARFIMFPGTLKTSICHAREGLFFPAFFLSIATLITATYRYAIPADNVTLNCVIRVVFWSYVSFTLVLAIGQYSYLFQAHKLEVRSMMPTWILPIFPVMLSGTIASVIAESQPESAAAAIVYGGLACQGLGISVSFLMYAHMVGRLMQYGLPNREHRPGLFMNVGPPAFTCLAFIGMANGLPDEFDSNGVMDIHFIRQMAVLGGVYLWGLSLWWLGVAIVAVLSSPPEHFHLGWWAAVFPNTGFTLATITLGDAIGSKAVQVFAVILSVCILITYCYVLCHNIRAVWRKEIMYPEKDEDVLEH